MRGAAGKRVGLVVGLAGFAFIFTGGSIEAGNSDRAKHVAVFGILPENMATADRPMTPARVDLGRYLYFDPRLSKNQDISCNSCHGLGTSGVDGEPTSPGHRGQRGGRNSPSVMNAGLHIAQFWDGRALDLEEQAQGPILNPIEMAMESEAQVLMVLNSIPGYPPLFAKAFPGEAEPVTYENMAIAIGAFERGLVTPSAFDRYLAGDDEAFSADAQAGLEKFYALGCATCHNGVGIGGGMYRRLGQVHPYETADAGRFEVTGLEADRKVFKVPSLRNVTETGPWFHDGSVESLDDAIRLMAWHQLGLETTPEDREQVSAFLRALKGQPDPAYVAEADRLDSGPDTPAADPN